MPGFNSSKQRRQRSGTFRSLTSQAGFTLIEIMIVVAVLSILAAIAYPSYQRHVERTRRVDALSFLSEVAGEQVRFFSENNRYVDKMSTLGYGADDTAESPEGYYTLSIVATDTTFTLTATPDTTGVQANDPCGALSLTSTGGKSVSGTATVDECW